MKNNLRKYQDSKIAYYQNSCDTGFAIFESLVTNVTGVINNQNEINHKNKILELQAQETEMQYQYAMAVEQYQHEMAIEQEQTNQMQIAAQRDIELAQIDATSRVEIAKNRDMINAQRDYEIEKLNIPVKLEQEKTAQQQIAMQNRKNELEASTEQMRIREQSKVLQKMLDAALSSYNRTVDFYQSQLQSAENFFLPQIKSMEKEILQLKQQQDRAFGDTESYIYLQKQINRLLDYKNNINDRYLKLQINLTTAVKLAKLEAPGSNIGFGGFSEMMIGV